MDTQNANQFSTDLLLQLSLLHINGIGCATIKKIVDAGIDPLVILKASKKDLKDLGIFTPNQIRLILSNHEQKIDEATILKSLQKYQLQPIFITDTLYPQRLLECSDPPVMLFCRGNNKLNYTKSISIIGTRANTNYGLKVVQHLIEGLQDVKDLMIVSGLAAGIDSLAHKASVAFGIPTIGVLGHGHDILYPAQNKPLAKQMLSQGAIISEYLPHTVPDKSNFPMRNRIVAGMADMTIVIESKEKGGAIITAKLASGYNRTVGAVPGGIFETNSKGCNELLANQIAIPITNAQDILSAMNWAAQKKVKPIADLFVNLSKEESIIINVLQQDGTIHIDELMEKSKFGYSTLANLLLQLELKNMVEQLPGKKISLL